MRPHEYLALVAHAGPGANQYHEATHMRVRAPFEDEALDLVFTLCNVGAGPGQERYESAVNEYRQLGNRSLSVGDVIVLSAPGIIPVAYKVASLGFTKLDEVPKIKRTPIGSARSAAHLAMTGASS